MQKKFEKQRGPLGVKLHFTTNVVSTGLATLVEATSDYNHYIAELHENLTT